MYKALYIYMPLLGYGCFLRQVLLLLVFHLGLVRGRVGTLDSDPRAHALACTSTPPRWKGFVQFSVSPCRRLLGFCSVINVVYKYFCFLGTQKDGTPPALFEAKSVTSFALQRKCE